MTSVHLQNVPQGSMMPLLVPFRGKLSQSGGHLLPLPLLECLPTIFPTTLDPFHTTPRCKATVFKLFIKKSSVPGIFVSRCLFWKCWKNPREQAYSFVASQSSSPQLHPPSLCPKCGPPCCRQPLGTVTSAATHRSDVQQPTRWCGISQPYPLHSELW